MVGTETELNRFALEEAIVACFNVVDDLQLVVEALLEGDPPPDTDAVTTMLMGVAELQKLRCDKAFNIFSQLLDARKIL